MITQQVVTYIKDQLARGTARDKIRANLLAAGWLEEDVKQAFSFAEPSTPSASLKIAPAFAVTAESNPENPVDKTELTKKDEPLMPILKRDNPTVNSALNTTVNPVVNPVRPNPVENINSLGNSPRIESVQQNLSNPVVSQPVANPVFSSAVNPVINQPASLNQNTNTAQPTASSVLGTIRPTPKIMEPVKSGNGGLKIIAVLLTIILIAGNVYLWMYEFPRIDKANSLKNVETVNANIDTNQTLRTESEILNNKEASVINSPAEALITPANKLQLAAGAYFTKYNSYGGASMAMGSCASAATVFEDVAVKAALSELSAIAKRVPQCSLIADDAPNTKVRTVGYVIYIPMEDSGYCIDSTGATLVTSTIPTGKTCTSGL